MVPPADKVPGKRPAHLQTVINPWVLLAIAIGWLASLTVVGFWQNDAGHVAERVKWQTRETKELAEANQKLTELQDKYRGQEQWHAEQLAGIGWTREQERIAHEKRRQADVAAARSGDIRLRFDLPTGQAICGSPTPEAAAPTGERDGPARGELPAEVTADLLSLANDADDVARQLGDCQAVILQDRAVKGAPSP